MNPIIYSTVFKYTSAADSPAAPQEPGTVTSGSATSSLLLSPAEAAGTEPEIAKERWRLTELKLKQDAEAEAERLANETIEAEMQRKVRKMRG